MKPHTKNEILQVVEKRGREANDSWPIVATFRGRCQFSAYSEWMSRHGAITMINDARDALLN